MACWRLPGGAAICQGDMRVNSVAYSGAVIEASVKPSQLPLKPSLLLLTHGHPDHYRYAHIYRGMGVKVAAPRHCLPLIEDPTINWMATIGWAGPIEEEMVTRYFLGCGVRVDTPLEPGETAGPARALAAPGHTPGHLAYIVETRDATLLAAGDTVLGQDYLERTPLPYHTNTLKLIETLDKLRRADVDILVPGHGEPAYTKREAHKLVERNINHINNALNLVESLLPAPNEEPAYPDEIIARLAEKLGYTRSRRAYSTLSPAVRAILLALKQQERAEAIIHRGVPAWRRTQRAKATSPQTRGTQAELKPEKPYTPNKKQTGTTRRPAEPVED